MAFKGTSFAITADFVAGSHPATRNLHGQHAAVITFKMVALGAS